MLEKLMDSCKKVVLGGLCLTGICFGKPIDGVCLSPFRAGQSPETGTFPTSAQVQEDLDIYQPIAEACRTYGNDNVLFNIPSYCNDRGIECVVGSWISDNAVWNQGVVDRLIQVSDANYSTTDSLLVGNEYLLWRPFSSENTIIPLINQVKAQTNLPVSTGETYNIWLDHPNLVNACDYIGAHIHPYWEGIHIDNAAQHVIDKYNLLKIRYPGKEIQILEVGWPSAGPAYGSAVPSPANQKKFLEDFIPLADAHDIKYFLFEGFDEPWKVKYGEVEKHWGMFEDNRQVKSNLSDILYAIPGDVDKDGDVDIDDLYLMSGDWLETTTSPEYLKLSDVNKDGITNFQDFAYVGKNWGR